MPDDKTTISGELIFKIREAALVGALSMNRHSAASADASDAVKIVADASALLGFLMNGQPSEVATVAGAPTAPKGGRAKKAATDAPTLASDANSTSVANSTSAAPAPASAQAQPATAAPGSAITGSPAASQTSIVPSPTTLQAAADSLKALVQDDSRGGRVAAVALLTLYGVAQLNQIPATKLAEFKAALDNAGKTAPAAAVAPGSDLL